MSNRIQGKQFFIHEYLDHPQTMKEIAAKYHCDWTSVQKYLSKYNAKKPWDYWLERKKTSNGYLCKGCMRDLPLEMFYHRPDGRCHKTSRCIDCSAIYGKYYRAKKRYEKLKISQRKLKTDVSNKFVDTSAN